MKFYLNNEKFVLYFGNKPKIVQLFIQKDFPLNYWIQLWTKNPNIKILSIDISNVFDGIENILKALTICQIQLEKLYIGNQGLNEYDGQEIAEFVKKNNSLTHLNLEENCLGTSCFKIIKALNGKDLKYLNLKGNDLSSRNILSLRYIKCGLKTLILNNNKIKSTEVIGYFLSKNSLSQLNLSNNEIIDIQPLIKGILKSQACDSCRLVYLNLSGNIFKKLPVSITQLKTVTNFYYINEELATIPQEVATWLATYKRNNERFWNDLQNTHDSSLLATVKHSLQKIHETTTLLPIPELIEEITKSNLDDDVKRHLLTFKSDKHGSIESSYQEVVHLIISRIVTYKNENKRNVLEVVNSEVKDGFGMCLTGQICRLVNSLNTYDECVKVSHIDLNESFKQTGLDLLRKGTYTTDAHKEAFESYLAEHSISLNPTKKEEFYANISIFEDVYIDIIQEELSMKTKRKRENDDEEDDDEESTNCAQKKQKQKK
jgi:hypothetical protein